MFPTTLVPTDEFGYNEHIFLKKRILLLDINVKTIQLQRVPLKRNRFLWNKILGASGTLLHTAFRPTCIEPYGSFNKL